MNEKNPIILLTPSIPPALHGVAPRTIWTQARWKKEREQAFESYDNRCASCNEIARDGHEHYEYDYEKGKSYFKCIYPLCNDCHDYIHNQRLYLTASSSRDIRELSKFWSIAYKGNKLLLEHDLFPNIVLMNTVLRAIADDNNLPDSNTRYWKHIIGNFQGIARFSLDQYEELGIMPKKISKEPKFEDWRLVVEGKEYKGKFSSVEEWRKHYKR